MSSWHIPLVEFCDFQEEERQRCVNANTTAEKGLFCFSNIYIQQDAHITEFILSDNCSTCFGRRHHPSSVAQNKCNYSIW